MKDTRDKAEVSSAEEQVVIPTVFLSPEEVEKLNKFLLLKAGCATSRKINGATLLMNTCGSNCNFKEVDIKYDVDKIGFKPNELVQFPKEEGGGIALCVGTSHNASEVYFIHEKHPNGVSYWPGINTVEHFFNKGFAKIGTSAV